LRRRRLGIPGETEFTGRGIIESATRDREQLTGKDVCIIGSGDAAAENALLLAEVCPTVTLVHRGKKMQRAVEFTEQLHTNHCITAFPESIVRRIIGGDSCGSSGDRTRAGNQAFSDGRAGRSDQNRFRTEYDLVSRSNDLDGRDFVIVSSRQETSVTNVFAIGDVANPLAPTIAGAVGAGATAAKVIASRLQKNLRTRLEAGYCPPCLGGRKAGSSPPLNEFILGLLPTQPRNS